MNKHLEKYHIFALAAYLQPIFEHFMASAIHFRPEQWLRHKDVQNVFNVGRTSAYRKVRAVRESLGREKWGKITVKEFNQFYAGTIFQIPV